MRRLFFLLVLPLLLVACSGYEKENKHLKDEIRMLKEENNYLKAEMIGLKKGIDEMSIRVREERESMKKKLQEERDQMQKKLQDEREAMQKKLQEISKKKTVVIRKEQKDNSGKNSPRPTEITGHTPPVMTTPR